MLFLENVKKNQDFIDFFKKIIIDNKQNRYKLTSSSKKEEFNMKNMMFGLFLTIPILASCNSNVKDLNLLHSPIKNAALQILPKEIMSRTAYKAIKDLSPYFANNLDGNYVLSPSSYLLAVSGLASVTEGFTDSSFGLEDATNDTQKLLTAWNFEYSDLEEGDYCFFKSAILHQQIGSGYAFGEEKREEFNQKHISTMVSNNQEYLVDAQKFFQDEIGLDLAIPDLKVDNGCATYAGLKMKDYVANGLYKKDCSFTTSANKKITTTAYSFGSSTYGKAVQYFDGTNYQAFKVNINYTDLLIVLPDKNVDLTSIDVAETYKDYLENAETKRAYGYVPFFHAKTEGEDISEALTKKLSGNVKPYSRLLEKGVTNDLIVNAVLQSSDFEFNEYGVAGESVTVVGSDTSPSPDASTPIELNVDRPFYAISLKDDFPIFVSMVLDPSQEA